VICFCFSSLARQFGHCQILDPVGDAVAFPKSYGILERPAHRILERPAHHPGESASRLPTSIARWIYRILAAFVFRLDRRTQAPVAPWGGWWGRSGRPLTASQFVSPARQASVRTLPPSLSPSPPPSITPPPAPLQARRLLGTASLAECAARLTCAWSHRVATRTETTLQLEPNGHTYEVDRAFGREFGTRA
jgi:hypothetical protein